MNDFQKSKRNCLELGKGVLFYMGCRVQFEVGVGGGVAKGVSIVLFTVREKTAKQQHVYFALNEKKHIN